MKLLDLSHALYAQIESGSENAGLLVYSTGTVEAQFNYILFRNTWYLTCSTVALLGMKSVCIVSVEIHQFFRPKMRQYFLRTKSLVFQTSLCEYHFCSLHKTKLRNRIRGPTPVPFRPLDPGSGMGKKS
jgi:hypothetical protein